MTTGTHSPTPQAGRPTAPGLLDPMRNVALAGGLAYLVSFAASIPQPALFADLVADPAGFLRSPGGDTVVGTSCPPPARSARSRSPGVSSPSASG